MTSQDELLQGTYRAYDAAAGSGLQSLLPELSFRLMNADQIYAESVARTRAASEPERTRPGQSIVAAAGPPASVAELTDLLRRVTSDRDRQVVATLDTLHSSVSRLIRRIDTIETSARRRDFSKTSAVVDAETIVVEPEPQPAAERNTADYLDPCLFDDPAADFARASAIAAQRDTTAPTTRHPFRRPAGRGPKRPAGKTLGKLFAAPRSTTHLPPKMIAVLALALFVAAGTAIFALSRAISSDGHANRILAGSAPPPAPVPGPASKENGPVPPPTGEQPGSQPSPPARLTMLPPAERVAMREEGSSAAPAPSANVELPPATVGPLSLRRAAASGDPSAQFEVATRLAEGKGTGQDFAAAVQWYLRSASRGFVQAQYRLGTHYERGLGVPRDVARARVWYERAAAQGNVKSMHNLAVLSTYQDSPDYAAAIRWFTEGAQHNSADSQFNLAVVNENGLGVSRDLKSAYKWYALAARNGDKEAARRRDTVGTALPAADRAAASDEVRNFNAKPLALLVNDPRAAGEDWKKRQPGL